VEVKRSIGL